MKTFSLSQNFFPAIIFLVFGCGSGDLKSSGSNPARGEGNTVELSPSRVEAPSPYQFTGVILNGGSLRCSGVLLAHGLMVTAKHCFSSSEEDGTASISEISLVFPNLNTVTASDERISIEDVIFDTPLGSGNDIAYITFDPALTTGTVDPFSGEINTSTVVPASEAMTTVGFPSTDDGSVIRLATKNCKRLDKEGTIGPNIEDKGYDGKLYDTNCVAWKGNSGGGFYTIDPDSADLTPLSLVGVVTHTFDLTSTGGIDPLKQSSDSYGTYVSTVNYSAFKDAEKLQEMLNLYQ